jgi:hypothetical protein
MVAVAQLVRAPDCGSGGRGFDSPRSPLGVRASVAGIAQLVERNLAKVEVAGSSPVARL